MRYNLAFADTFYLNRRVPADDRVKSLTGVGASAQTGAIAFTTTRWSVVLTAQGESPAADQALEKLCRTYWYPLYAFVRRGGTRAGAVSYPLTTATNAVMLSWNSATVDHTPAPGLSHNVRASTSKRLSEPCQAAISPTGKTSSAR